MNRAKKWREILTFVSVGFISRLADRSRECWKCKAKPVGFWILFSLSFFRDFIIFNNFHFNFFIIGVYPYRFWVYYFLRERHFYFGDGIIKSSLQEKYKFPIEKEGNEIEKENYNSRNEDNKDKDQQVWS